jgi:hypothetical protein
MKEPARHPAAIAASTIGKHSEIHRAIVLFLLFRWARAGKELKETLSEGETGRPAATDFARRKRLKPKEPDVRADGAISASETQ